MTYAGDKSDAGVGSWVLGWLLCSIWISLLRIDLIPLRNSSTSFGRILTRKDGALNVRCTLRMRFWASYISFKTLFCIMGYIMLSFRRIWVSMGVVRHPVSYPTGTRYPFPGVKRPAREADHSPPSSAEVKNAWSYNSTPQYVFIAWCLVKHRDNFTFTSVPRFKSGFAILALPQC
jgi:hypothetical protein